MRQCEGESVIGHLGGGGALLRMVPLRAVWGALLTVVVVDCCSNDKEGLGKSPPTKPEAPPVRRWVSGC